MCPLGKRYAPFVLCCVPSVVEKETTPLIYRFARRAARVRSVHFDILRRRAIGVHQSWDRRALQASRPEVGYTVAHRVILNPGACNLYWK